MTSRIKDAIGETAENARIMVEAAETSARMVDESMDMINRMRASAETIGKTNSHVAESMSQLQDKAREVQQITEVIFEISSQTNLLALNASIESARAGEAGKGFAVVADQIRQLAEQSANSAAETRTLIETSLKAISDGSRTVDVVNVSLNRVVEGIGVIAASAKQISEMSNNQAEAMNQAEMGVSQISEVVQNNSAAAEESSATSEELSAQAMTLDSLISKFKLPSTF